MFCVLALIVGEVTEYDCPAAHERMGEDMDKLEELCDWECVENNETGVHCFEDCEVCVKGLDHCPEDCQADCLDCLCCFCDNEESLCDYVE